nr:hypothetical protein [Paenisporosarcina sp. TG20]
MNIFPWDDSNGGWHFSDGWLLLLGSYIAELKSELKNKDKHFIDVRTPYEFKTNHKAG